ncbi:MAG: ATP-binding cassette domain-containing protein, partial [Paenisporosarcina sp.]|nr:ATP-binding cassette domain-containing protein [Paenisporosarcina sp.]
MISINGLHKQFGDLEVLKGIDLQVNKGQVIVVIGPSGSGKTTLLRCLNILEVPTAGSITIDEQTADFSKTVNKRTVDLLRRESAMVFQHYNLFPHMTALQNVMEGPVIVKKMSKTDARAKAEQLLNKVGLGDKLDFYPHQLSGGQQ